MPLDSWGAVRTLRVGEESWRIHALHVLENAGLVELARLPYSIRVLLENSLRYCGEGHVTEEHVRLLCGWRRDAPEDREFPFMPARVVLQDLTGVPCIVDLAAMRSAMSKAGLDPRLVNPLVPVDLVIDHSLQVDYAGRLDALDLNMDLEYRRNEERYKLFRWAQREFQNLRVTPPGTGIVHQVNLEALSPVVATREGDDGKEAFPDTVVGADSHTTMINGLGVVGWGVGGIEAEAVMLGQPYFMLPPRVVGVRFHGRLRAGALATDLALTVTNLLRREGVVGAFVEFFGPGVTELSLPDRATVANMAPEYGATMGYFPVDDETLAYLLQTRNDACLVALVEAYCREQSLFRHAEAIDPEYSQVVELDLGEVRPCVAGPRRPQDVAPLDEVPARFFAGFSGFVPEAGDEGGAEDYLVQVPIGAVAVAAITSCTNTSNPRAMIAAGLLARNAVEVGLVPPPWVKTSLTPGSRAAALYLKQLGLLEPLVALGFAIAGYGCATCIGNSGELQPQMEEAVRNEGTVVSAVLSGNRNFEARIHPLIKANYLVSPPLVVAYALAGAVTVDLTREPLGTGANGGPVFLHDLWPPESEIAEAVAQVAGGDVYGAVQQLRPDPRWAELEAPSGALYPWDMESMYLREPPFVAGRSTDETLSLRRARILAILGDSVTTDHISPAGRIAADGPAGAYLAGRGVEHDNFNTFGSRRGNHEVLMRGTFANPRLRNAMAPTRDGGYTTHHPSGECVDIFEAARRYAEAHTPLVLVTGKEYGTGSSRDWAAKGPVLLGVKAVIAQSFERIHRSNLVGMGVLPLEFLSGEGAQSCGLLGDEVLSIDIPDNPVPGAILEVKLEPDDGGTVRSFLVKSRLDSEAEVEYYRAGGILPRVFALLMAKNAS
ncbi:MAG: aconitate hydratase AcnA [Actinobacteria bacterium]|nr:aconitate hydratase AcnA [Actinomycetota bacterium]